MYLDSRYACGAVSCCKQVSNTQNWTFHCFREHSSQNKTIIRGIHERKVRLPNPTRKKILVLFHMYGRWPVSHLDVVVVGVSSLQFRMITWNKGWSITSWNITSMLPTVLYCTASPDPNQNNEKVYIMNVQLSSYALSINTYRNIKEDIVLHVTKAHWLMSIQFRFLLLCHTFFFSLSLSGQWNVKLTFHRFFKLL